MDQSKNALPIELSILDSSSTIKELVVHEVLNLHKALLAEPITDAEYEAKYKDTGFLSLCISYEEFLERLDEGSLIIIARQQGVLVGYLLLSELDRLFEWLKQVKHLEILSHISRKELERTYRKKHVKVLTQIAVTPSLIKRGVGRLLVDYAKKLAPLGMLTTIRYKPVANKASLAFFSKQGFLHVATVFVADGRQIYIAFWE